MWWMTCRTQWCEDGNWVGLITIGWSVWIKIVIIATVLTRAHTLSSLSLFSLHTHTPTHTKLPKNPLKQILLHESAIVCLYVIQYEIIFHPSHAYHCHEIPFIYLSLPHSLHAKDLIWKHFSNFTKFVSAKLWQTIRFA